MNDKLKEIMIELEKERKILNEKVEKYGFNHEETLAQSQVVDKVLVDYYKIRYNT